MLTKEHRILVAGGGLVGIILVVLLLWYEGELNIYKRAVGPIFSRDYSNLKYRPEPSVYPCSDNFTQADWDARIYFCYNTTRIEKKIIIPVSAFQYAYDTWDPSRYMGYDFYLDSCEWNTGTSWWGDTFITTGSWSSSSYGWTTLAQQWKQIITNLTVTSTFVSMNLNSNSMPLNEEKCSAIRLCAWAAGDDPCWELRLCPLFIVNTTKAASTSGGILKPRGGQERVKRIIIVDKDPDADDWFKMTTGISKIDNNWLLMVEQAAYAAKTDCVICMGARPLLQDCTFRLR